MARRPVFVIVGAGLAGVRAAEALRDSGFDGRVLLIDEEAERPYNRPPLSKDYLQRLCERDKVFLHPLGFYAERDIELRLGERVTAVDPAAHRVRVTGGTIAYDRLLLATGSAPRRLRLPGSTLPGVHYLRTLPDCEAITAAFGTARTVVIVGAGWVGLESAAAARSAGVAVTVLERAHLPLLGVLGPELGQLYADLHAGHGVNLRFDAEVEEIIGDAGRVVGVRLSDGSRVDADAVIVGVGTSPNVELARGAGIAVDNGVLVDAHLASSDPDVFAAGDIANVPYPCTGARLRLEHWSAAFTQGPVAAANMAGQAAVLDEVPYFFSDQYEMGMEYYGHAEPGSYERVVFRGDVAGGEYLAFWVNGSRVLAAMNVNVWDQGDALSALIRSSRDIDAARLADPATELAELTAAPAATGSPRTAVTTSTVAMPRRDPFSDARVTVVIATPLEQTLVSRIRAVDPRVDVLYEAYLLPPARFPGDHRSVDAIARTAEQQQRWERVLGRAEVLYGLPADSPAGLRQTVRANAGLRWIQGTAGGTGQEVTDAELTDAEYARVLVTSAAGVHAAPRAEFALLGVLAFTKGLFRVITDAHHRHWDQRPVGELAGRTMLVVGLGATGREVTRLATAFGMSVLGINRTGQGDVAGADMIRPPRFLADLLPRAHAVVLALPLTAQTRGMLDAQAFDRMRHGAVLVNVGHGAVVDEDALTHALANHRLGGAALDALAAEPLPEDSPLWRLPNVLISPHTAAQSMEENERIVALFAENLRRYLRGDDLIGRVRPRLPR